jgi:hypothetical protein
VCVCRCVFFIPVSYYFLCLQPGQHARELNPYWKDGGSGLPSATQEAKKTDPPSGKRVMEDCGLGWLKKAYQRCITQAEERGCSVEEVAAERYGVCMFGFFFWTDFILKLLFSVAEKFERPDCTNGAEIRKTKRGDTQSTHG